jgi:Dyp-type peroxidase family
MSAPAPLPGIEAADIQGNVLHGYGNALPHACYVAVRIPAAVAGRRLLTKLRPRVTDALHWGDNTPKAALNIAISHRGLDRLGVPGGVLESFPPEFADGMKQRAAEHLGDGGNGAHTKWEPPLTDIELLVVLHAADPARLARECERLADDAADAGVTVDEPRQEAHRLEGSREHFGFADGLAQPAIAGAPSANDRGQGVRRRLRGERPLALGEFVLGYRDEDGMLPVAPAWPFARNGTFMVFRKLVQDVVAFRDLLKEIAERDFGGDQELTAAKIAGRWRDGTPLTVRPSAAVPAPRIPPEELNAFGYHDDPRGYTCPIGAHIRRANPRDSLFDGDVRTRRHRIIRRGMPYGAPLPDGARDEAVRGLMFVCFNASIARQFEVVNGWLRDGAPFGLGVDTDVLTGDGNGSGKMTFQGDVPVLSRVRGPLVWTRGGEYLFLPSLGALDVLAAGGFGGA